MPHFWTAFSYKQRAEAKLGHNQVHAIVKYHRPVPTLTNDKMPFRVLRIGKEVGFLRKTEVEIREDSGQKAVFESDSLILGNFGGVICEKAVDIQRNL